MVLKRLSLLLLVIGILAGQASGGMYYTPSASTAAQLRDLSYTDPGGKLKWVGYNDGTPVTSPQVGVHVFGSATQYGEEMCLAVGFMGKLSEDLLDSGSYASVTIGAKNSPSALDTIQHAGSFIGFRLPIANDDDDPWDYALYVTTTGDDYASSFFTTLAAGTKTVLTLGFGGAEINFHTVEDLGFVIRGEFGHGSPSNPDFYHTSVVPVPAGVILVVLGLGVAGVKLRKYV